MGSVPIKLFDDPPIRTNTTVCNWAAPTFGNMGQTALHTVLAGVAFAIALWTASEQLRIFRMRYRLAEDYARIAEEEWNRYNEFYRPLENDMLEECMASPWTDPDYAGAEAEYGGMADAASARGLDHMRELAARYSLCVDPSLSAGLGTDAAVMRTDAVNYGYRDAEWYAQNKNDVRFNRRSNLLNLGRDLVMLSAKFGQVTNTVLEGASASAHAATSGAMYFMGYMRNRNATYYPQFMSEGTATNAGTMAGGNPAMTSMMSVDSSAG
jgi:hypothetical protein